MTDKEKTAEILKRLQKVYPLNVNHILVPEFRFGCSYFGGASQRQIDLFAIDYRKGNPTISCEIKVSRSDFQNDMKNEEKQRGARLFGTFFYYCTPKGMLKPSEVPVWAGLWEFDLDQPATDDEQHLTRVLDAPTLPRENPTWEIIISALRRVDCAHKEGLDRELEKARMTIKTYREAQKGIYR